MSGSRSQRKGRNAELELCRILNDNGYPVRAGLPHSYGLEPDLVGLKNIHIEVKRTEILRLDDAMDQATRDSIRFGDGLPVVFSRRNRSGWLCTMKLKDWLQMYEGKLK